MQQCTSVHRMTAAMTHPHSKFLGSNLNTTPNKHIPHTRAYDSRIHIAH